jgi:hypothetical protein
MDLKNRKVASFRAHLDPMIGPKPRNSFDRRELPNWELELTPIGICVTARIQVPGAAVQVSEHVVPYANIQSIKLMPEEQEEKKGK